MLATLVFNYLRGMILDFGLEFGVWRYDRIYFWSLGVSWHSGYDGTLGRVADVGYLILSAHEMF